uniref:glucuronosyltransferase n=1 Tax=Panagrellus redivivus TaxID=6233 RepID=A0A7E4VN42_PANRE
MKMHSSITVLICAGLLSSLVNALADSPLRILVTVPAISYSHITFQGHLADILAEEGHYVHFAIHELRPITANGAKKAKVTHILTSVPEVSRASTHKALSNVFINETVYDANALDEFGRQVGIMCKDIMQNETYFDMLVEERFDVAIAEEFDPCSFAMFKRLGIEAVIMSTPMLVTDTTAVDYGLYYPRSYSNFIFNGFLNAPKLTFFQRLSAIYRETKFYFDQEGYKYYTQQTLDNLFGKGTYNLPDLYRGVSLIFTNGNDLVDTARQTTSKIVPIGGLAMAKSKPLKPDVEEIVNSSKGGIVFFSFGSQIDLSTLPLHLKQNFFNAFARFPEISFILRYNYNASLGDDVIDHYPNVYGFHWLHQTSLLNHPKTRGFITHGGRNSLTEALAAGVPTIAIPLFADQPYNSALFKQRGVGVVRELHELTEDQIADDLNTILYNPKLRQNADVLKAKLESTPFSAREKFLKWVAFVGKFKQFPEFDLPGATMGVVQLYNLDIYAAMVSIVLVLGFSIVAILRTVRFEFLPTASKPKSKKHLKKL